MLEARDQTSGRARPSEGLRASLHKSHLFTTRGFFAATHSHIFRALPGKRAGIRPQKRCQKQPRKTLSRSGQQPSKSTPQPENIWIPATKLRWGKQLLPALDRGQEALDRAHRSNAECADVCKKLRSPDGFCRGVSFHLVKNFLENVA